MRGIEKNLCAFVALCEDSDIVHKSNIVELLRLFNAMADSKCLARTCQELKERINKVCEYPGA